MIGSTHLKLLLDCDWRWYIRTPRARHNCRLFPVIPASTAPVTPLPQIYAQIHVQTRVPAHIQAPVSVSASTKSLCCGGQIGAQAQGHQGKCFVALEELD